VPHAILRRSIRGDYYAHKHNKWNRQSIIQTASCYHVRWWYVSKVAPCKCRTYQRHWNYSNIKRRNGHASGTENDQIKITGQSAQKPLPVEESPINRLSITLPYLLHSVTLVPPPVLLFSALKNSAGWKAAAMWPSKELVATTDDKKYSFSHISLSGSSVNIIIQFVHDAVAWKQNNIKLVSTNIWWTSWVTVKPGTTRETGAETNRTNTLIDWLRFYIPHDAK